MPKPLDTHITKGPADPLDPKWDKVFDDSSFRIKPADFNDQYLTMPQRQLKFMPDMTPLALLYLLAIHEGDFDKRLHMGHFSTHTMFKQRIRDLMDMGFIAYDGQHCLKPAGAAHVTQLLLVKS